MLKNGQILENIMTSANASFYQQFTSPDQMVTAIKTRMLGMVTAFAYVPSSTTGWLVCDGSEYAANLHQDLANLIRGTYSTPGTGSLNPEGDWVGRFRVPDLRGLFIMGSADPAKVTTINTTTAIPRHSHTFTSNQLTTSQVDGTHSHRVKNLIQVRHVEDTDRVNNNNAFNTAAVHKNTATVSPSIANNHSHTATGFSMIFGNTSGATTMLTENRPRNAAVVFCIYAGAD
jgi:microcystin-dependent protein